MKKKDKWIAGCCQIIEKYKFAFSYREKDLRTFNETIYAYRNVYVSFLVVHKE